MFNDGLNIVVVFELDSVPIGVPKVGFDYLVCYCQYLVFFVAHALQPTFVCLLGAIEGRTGRGIRQYMRWSIRSHISCCGLMRMDINFGEKFWKSSDCVGLLRMAYRSSCSTGCPFIGSAVRIRLKGL